MLTRIRHQVDCPWIRRPRGVAFAIALVAVLSSSSAFAQCRGGSGGAGGMAGGGGTGGAGGIGLSSVGVGNGAFAMGGRGQTGGGQNGAGFFSVPSEQMFQPAFAHVVDDNYQYVAARRAARAARAEQARQRLAFRTERPSKQRTVAANVSAR